MASSAASLVSAAVSLLKHHPSKSRWHEISLLLSPAGISPADFSLVALSLRSAPGLALRFFHLTLHRRLCRHSLSSRSALIHTLARSRTHKPQTLDLIQSTLVEFPDRALDLFRTLTRTYREFDSAPVVFDLLVKALVRSRRIEEAIEIARLLRSRVNCRKSSRLSLAAKSMCEDFGKRNLLNSITTSACIKRKE